MQWMRTLPLVFAVALSCSHSEAVLTLAPSVTEPQGYRLDNEIDTSLPLPDRVQTAPASLVDYLTRDNIANGFPERPTSPPVDEHFIRDVRQSILDLPVSVQTAVTPLLAGVYIVRELGGTAYTEYAYSRKNRVRTAIVVLDYDMLLRTANEWATWKENTPFRPDPDSSIKVTIEDTEGNTRQNAIQYILLHELAHVLSVGADAHPSWRGAKKDPSRFGFSKVSWVLLGDTYLTRDEETFPTRGSIRYYWGGDLNYEVAPTVYSQALSSGFVSLYAATNPYDDFADTFAYFVHTRLQRRPYWVELVRHGKVEWAYSLDDSHPAIAAKFGFISEILGYPYGRTP